MKLPPAFLATLAITQFLSASFYETYQLENIPLPENCPPEVGAITFDSKGDLYVCLRRSDVFRATPTADPKKFQWHHFASGFHNGCGMIAPEPGKILVSQMAELTAASDTDGDSKADTYLNLANGWGLSGNYHETNALCPDGDCGYYLAIGTASHNGPTFFHTQDEYSKAGRRGRNFSSVKYRGWILHLDSKNTLTPVASGFRMHNGLCIDSEKNLWCSDNQGDWKSITPFYHIEKGNFYGHPSSLVWDEKWKDKDPLATYRDDLDAYNKHRTLPAVLLPHGELCRSGAEPVQIPVDGSFGKHYAGQYILPDNNSKRLCRIMIETVKGKKQGMATLFYKDHGLRSGNNRTRFSPDGKTLYIGQTVRGWGRPAEGLQRITYTGKTPFDLAKMNLIHDGFRLTFTAPVSNLKKEHLKFTSATYQPKWTYGSPAENKKNHPVTTVKKIDAHTYDITLSNLTAGTVIRLETNNIKSESGNTPHNTNFYYTANQLR